MNLWNRLVVAVLCSRWHRLLSGTTLVLRYAGARSGTQFTLPVHYALGDDDIVIMVGRPENKSWWRNFRAGREVEVLRAGLRTSMTGRAFTESEEPELTASLLAAYRKRFPRICCGPRGMAFMTADCDAR